MNRLAKQSSPYLLQHSENPVEWHPWDEEALALAKKENKPILLSIGYSACHWCHTMAHESFENTQVAKIMNTTFVNIKVDREERPDIDRLYQITHQMLTRSNGGWPLTVFLDPTDLIPLYSGTYFPPQATKEKPSFREVLKGIGNAYGDKKRWGKDFKSKIKDAISTALTQSIAGKLDVTLVERACGQIDSSFDEKRGGFSEAPKFPHAPGLALLHDVGNTLDAEKSERAQHMLDMTLSGISCGGIFDHLGGGFFRYSVDADWTIPHFEKMLYDNGLLLSLFAERAEALDSDWFRAVVHRSATWLVNEMQLDSGGIRTSIDADSEGEEGKFYTWSKEDLENIKTICNDDFLDTYGLNSDANFNDKWHLRITPPDADEPNIGYQISEQIEESRSRLIEVRHQRQQPFKDDKVLVSWNALAIKGLLQAGAKVGEEDYINAAEKAIDYIRETHWSENHLLSTSRNGKAHIHGYLDDYAYLLDAILASLSMRWNSTYLQFATELADTMIDRFESKKNGGFFFSAKEHRTPIQRAMFFSDDSLPNGNGIAIKALLEIGLLIGNEHYTKTAKRALKLGVAAADRWPSTHSTVLGALLHMLKPPPRIVIRYSSEDALKRFLQEASEKFPPRSRFYNIAEAEKSLPGPLSETALEEGQNATAFLYSGNTLSSGLNSTDELLGMLKSQEQD